MDASQDQMVSKIAAIIADIKIKDKIKDKG
jgi:hypothetical protein